MRVTTLSSREFNQDMSGAKKAARKGPVFITDRGRPAHVLMSIEDYRRLAGGRFRCSRQSRNLEYLTSTSSLPISAMGFSNRPIFPDVRSRHQHRGGTAAAR